ncbi:L-ascorbate oxidase homolog [Phragmites australis]|uniref:L-ascorbate oxidase homolog n=1 Tax=Phragmites australis TaxID=29695 RepID=UPI002D76E4E5|nr:L-ascorbate oxidase homolog [Phragmites australis]
MAGRDEGALVLLACICLSIASAVAEAPYRFFDWEVTYGDISPLGVSQQGILINGQFPGPEIECQTNENLIINVRNSLPEPFLLSWNGLQQRKNSWQDGLSGTNCPIPPGQNFTYHMQAKDQIGSFFYFPSLAFHKAAGGFGAIRIQSRPQIPVPFPPPAGEYTVLIGDWYSTNHKALQATLDNGNELPSPDGILINGKGPDGANFAVEQGKTYRLRISNVGLQNTLNLMIQDHNMTLVEVEGTHTLQNSYTSLDVHAGQSLSVVFTANRPARDYRIAVSTRFANSTLDSTAILRYTGSSLPVSGSLAAGPSDVDFSLNQARSIRTNLTASGPRPNPQGSYHYGSINVTRTIRLANSAGQVGGKRRYAVNGVSFVEADTPLKLADYYNISGVFRLGGIPDAPADGAAEVRNETAVMDSDHRSFVEVVLENSEDSVQSWHLDGYSVFVVGMDVGTWSELSRDGYNLVDAVSRCTVQVYPRGWTAILIALDNVGMWNLRSEVWARRYLGQQFYLRVYTPTHSFRDELPIPDNALLCGRATATNS